MIDKMILKAGSSSSQPPLEIELSPLTLVVGPNNSGKSLLLRELKEFGVRVQGFNGEVLDNLILTSYTREEFEPRLREVTLEPLPNDRLAAHQVVVGKISGIGPTKSRVVVDIEGIIREAQNPNESRNTYYVMLHMNTLELDGNNRIHMVAKQNSGDLKADPENGLRVIFDDNGLREHLRAIIFHAFGRHLVLDSTETGKIGIRFSNRLPVDEAEEKNWDSRAVDFQRQAIPIESYSDGVKAFTGIVTSILATDSKIILVDEPEAFLHPTLSNQLGKVIGESVRGTDKRVFASTHSSSFLMGCIESNVDVNVIRLTYDGERATSRLLPKDELKTLMLNPLLRSVGVLDGLFNSSVVVSEADSDRAFYQEINRRCLEHDRSVGISDCLFIGGSGKSTIWDIIGILRKLGIPAAAIVDIDVIKDGGAVWTKVLKSVGIPEAMRGGLGTQRGTFKRKFLETGSDMKREGGMQLLESSDKEAFQDFIDTLAKYGLFVIPNGELESWLKPLGATGHGPTWLTRIFEGMGEDPQSPDYVGYQEGDVWDFIGIIRAWVTDPNRNGIPN